MASSPSGIAPSHSISTFVLRSLPPLLLLIAALLPSALPLSFNFSSFVNNDNSTIMIKTNGDAVISKTESDPGIRLTRDRAGENQGLSVGRAVYKDPLLLWDATSGNLTDFVTHFSFVISRSPDSEGLAGDGLAFFLAPQPAYEIPNDSQGAYLGLYSPSAAVPVVAVEFDTFHNGGLDPPYDIPDGYPLYHHVGIDVFSIRSVAFTLLDDFEMVTKNDTAHATVSNNASTANLSVVLSYHTGGIKRSWLTSTSVDLRKYLPEDVSVGFSASTGLLYEMHTILSWDFSSTLEKNWPVTNSSTMMARGRASSRLSLDIILGILLFLCGIGLSCIVLWCWRRQRMTEDDELSDGGRGILGPKSFQFDELAAATRNFDHGRKLGEGGFGSVYYGVMRGTNHHLEVAIKRISKASVQGKKEYVSEITVISRLRHRNLVQLVGYCHERGEFLLVYQYMRNGSLDSHLYNREKLLRWPERYKIVVGLASALFYLHDEWDQCVLHRDLKPSNVLLDEDFNPKLGDFGLARLVDHDNCEKTTALAGTRGYMAPEYEETGKTSKESDVYAFGVVALEIACGRRPMDFTQGPGKVSLVGWVRYLYEKGMCLAAADPRLLDEGFDERLMERLMVVGLLCVQPDYKLRPSIGRVVGILDFDAPLPELPHR